MISKTTNFVNYFVMKTIAKINYMEIIKRLMHLRVFYCFSPRKTDGIAAIIAKTSEGHGQRKHQNHIDDLM